MRNNTMIYENNSFFIVPKDIEKYNISNDAIMLYARMLDLSKLSKKNNWIDKNGQVYIIFTIEKIKQVLKCGKTKAIKLLNELRNPLVGLIKTVRRGLNKPNLIYVKNIIPTKTISENKEDKTDEINKIKEKIQFDEFGTAHQDIIVNVLKSLKSKKVKVAGKFVKSQQILDSLSKEVLLKAFEQMANSTSTINNITSYILTVIYNILTGTKTAPTTTPVTAPAPVKVPTVPVKKNRFVNYEQREWDFEKLRKLEREYIKKQLED